MGVDDADGGGVPVGGLEIEGGEMLDIQAEFCEEGGGFGACYGYAGAGGGDVGQLYVVHDDEAVEDSHEAWELCGGGFEEEGVGFSEDVGVALNAALDAENETVGAFAGFQILNGVCDHAVEPADSVFAGGADPASLGKGRYCGFVKQGVELGRGRVGDFGLGGGGHGGR